MNFLYALESIRTPFTDAFFSLVTYFGDETVLIATALILLWCFNKRWGYFLLYIGLWGVNINQLLKNIYCIPRPWVYDPNFTIVESARAAATGYSFPSGHTQNAVTVFGGLAALTKARWAKCVFLGVVALTAFSRMYLGVHTPTDVFISLAVGVILIAVFYPLHHWAEHRPARMNVLRTLLLLFSVLLPIILTNISPQHAEAELSAEGVKNAYTSLGVTLGFFLMQMIDEKKLHFPTDAVPWAQAVKLCVGFVLVMAAKELLKTPLHFLTGGSDIAHAIRYFLIVIIGGVLWPMTFPFFSSLGRAKSE